MQSGRLKVFSSLEKVLRERKLYRQDDRGQIIRKHDNLMDALRCLVNGIVHMRTKPVKQPPTHLRETMEIEVGGCDARAELRGPCRDGQIENLLLGPVNQGAGNRLDWSFSPGRNEFLLIGWPPLLRQVYYNHSEVGESF